MLEDITNINLRPSPQSANFLNRLINMRKLKDTENTSFFTENTNSWDESSVAEEIDVKRNMRQPNFQQLKDAEHTSRRDMSEELCFHQRRDSKSQCSTLP